MGKEFEWFVSTCVNADSFIQFSNKINAYQYKKPFTIISRFLSSKSQALDWGCGNGHLSAFLVYNLQKTTAYGFGETSCPSRYACNNLFEFIAADTKEPVKLPFEDCSFDLVLSMGVLEHVHESGGDQLASLQEINRILKPTGYFLCFHFPYSGSWVEMFLRSINIFNKSEICVHTKRFSKKDAIRLVHDAGLNLRAWGRYNFLPRNISQKFPVVITNNTLFVLFFNTCDTVLASIFPWFCNQSYFIAQKNRVT
ncbi:MAG: class I SAM-dependent methyltransferase [Desulfovibrionaceae bacterium]|nr:class I SAM-dependent methyltransferase [Desulfovibrionaceae bacterium]